MTKQTKIIIGASVSIIIILLITVLTVILFSNERKYIGTWYVKDIYIDETIITTYTIKRNKTLEMKTEYTKAGRINIDKGKWSIDKEENALELTFGDEDEDTMPLYLYYYSRNVLCQSSDCSDSEKLYKKKIINLKEYNNVYDEIYYNEDEYDEEDDEEDEEDEDEESTITPVMTQSKNYSFDSEFDIEDTNKVPIYIFYGNGCPHCEELFEALDSLDKSMKDTFVVKMYEVWYSKDNSEYMEKVATARNEMAEGVPYTIIGDNSWNGFTKEYLDEMVDAIKEKPTVDIEKELRK